MRKEAREYTIPEVREIGRYHGCRFQSLKFFNSDRVINLAPNYTVSDDNTASTKKIAKVGAPVRAFGLELETVSPIKNAVNETVLVNVIDLAMLKAGFPEDFFKIEQDCTVDAECITQTFSKAWLRNNYKCFKAMYEVFGQLSVTTNSQKCGMHVNIDLSNLGKDRDEQIKNARKLAYLINKHYDFFKVAVYRNGTTQWCPRMNATKEYWKNTELWNIPTSHNACCVNMGHVNEGRIEIRLVGGQKNYACFRNTMEVVFHIVDAVKTLSWDALDDLTKVFDKCNYHVADRIYTNCRQAGVISEADAEKIKANSTTERFL